MTGEDDLLPNPPPERRRRSRTKGRALFGLAAAAVLIGSGTGVSLSLATSASGASTPAAAVEAFLTSVGRGDFIGMLGSLDPGEREAWEPGVESIFGQLQRLGMISSQGSLGDITGISFRFTGLVTKTTQLTPELAAVFLTGGTVTSSLDVAALPLGDVLKNLLGGALQGKTTTTTAPATSGKFAIAAVKTAGGWYVSIGYTAAVDILRALGQNGAPPPAYQALKPVGATSPEGAVRLMFSSVSDLDLEGVIADLAPGEMAAMDAYAPDWLYTAQAALNSIRDKLHVDVRAASYDVSDVPEGTLVTVNGVTMAAQGFGANVSYADGCYSFSYKAQGRRVCAASSEQQLLALLPPAAQPVFKRVFLTSGQSSFVTVQEDGSWYVSVARTYFYDVADFLSRLQPSDFGVVARNFPAIERAIARWLEAQVGPDAAGLPFHAWRTAARHMNNH